MPFFLSLSSAFFNQSPFALFFLNRPLSIRTCFFLNVCDLYGQSMEMVWLVADIRGSGNVDILGLMGNYVLLENIYKYVFLITHM